MSLNNVDSSNGYLEATAADGDAVSEPIVQDTGIDISESIVPDVGLVNELVSETDIVFVKKIDNSFNKLTVGAVTEIAALETKSAIHTNYTTDGHIILTSSTSINNSYPFWKAMNGTNIATSEESAGLGTYTANQWMEYTFPASEIITRVRINGRVDQLAGNKIEQLKVYVWDGASFVLLHTETFTLDWALLEIRNVDFVNTTSSTKYRFEFVGDGDSYAIALSWFELLGASASKYQFDTTSVTLGEVPSAIFKADTFDGNFSRIKNISADFELVNISTATVADTLTTDETIVDGDNLVIVKDDDSIHEVVASGVTGVGPYSMDTTAITAGEIPSRVFTVDSKVSFDDGTGFIYPSELGNDYLAGADVVPAPDLTPGLVAHYLLNNNADDSFGTYDGTTSGGTDFQGDSTYFDGVDDFVDCNINNTVNLECVSLWEYFDEEITAVSDAKILGTLTTSHAHSWIATGGIAVAMNDETFSFYEGAVIGHVYIKDNIPLGWNNIVIQWETDKYVIYLNGQSVTNYYATNIPKLSLDILLGKRVIGVHASSQASNLRVYDASKNQDFIDALFEEGYYPKPLPLPTTEGLIAHYPLTGVVKNLVNGEEGSESTLVEYAKDAEFGAVLDASSVDSRVDFTGQSSTSGDWTVCVWVRANDTGGGGLAREIFGGGIYSFRFRQINSSYMGITKAGVSDYKLYVIPPNNEWIFMTFTGNSSTFVKLYFNTVYQTQLAASIELTINRFSNGDSNSNFGGFIKSGRVYDRIITQEEMEDIYNYEKNFRPIDIDDGLVAYYPLANNSLDNYNNQYDGVDTAITYDGVSANFNGSTSYITSPSVQTKPLSCSLWVHRNPTDGGGWAIDLGNYVQLVMQTDNTLGLYYGGNNIADYVVSTDVIVTSDTWLNIIFTIDSSNTVYIYVDGTEITITHPNASATTATTSTTVIGGRGDGTGTPSILFLGEISKVRIYNKIISEEQVKIIYNTEKGDFIPDVTSLTNTRQYDDIVVDGRSIETKVELKSIADKCTEVSADLWKNP